MNIRCPHCQTLFRVDPARVPASGIRARCARCGGTFQIAGASAAPPASAAPGRSAEGAAPATRVPEPSAAVPGAAAASGAAPAGTGAAPGTQPTGPAAPARPTFGSRDPNARAQRIARALVSDIVAYHPERRDQALQAGTLRSEFRDEIMKSWEEYVAQVGQEIAKSTPYFRQALNEILARGEAVF